jgi:NADH-quinone oxidoreductase subunit E
MKKPGSHVSSEKAGRMLKADAPNARGSGGPGGRLDPEVERWFATAGAAFPSSRSSIIPMLQAAHAALGYLPRDAMQAIARHVVVPPALVEGVASFYAQFRFNKPGRHRVTFCTGTACYVRGSGKLMDELGASLGVAAGDTTADGEFTLETVACFGACALAPVVVIDGTVNGRVNAVSLKANIDRVGKRVRPALRAKAGA